MGEAETGGNKRTECEQEQSAKDIHAQPRSIMRVENIPDLVVAWSLVVTRSFCIAIRHDHVPVMLQDRTFSGKMKLV